MVNHATPVRKRSFPSFVEQIHKATACVDPTAPLIIVLVRSDKQAGPNAHGRLHFYLHPSVGGVTARTIHDERAKGALSQETLEC